MPRSSVYAYGVNPKVDPAVMRKSDKLLQPLIDSGYLVRISPRAVQFKVPQTKPVEDQSLWSRSNNFSRGLAARGSAGVCAICGFDRFIERAHIVPARFGGPVAEFNILPLCPNHHRLFDHNLLTLEEFRLIEPMVRNAIQMRSTDPLLVDWRKMLESRYGFTQAS
jgi:hypothetical protein